MEPAQTVLLCVMTVDIGDGRSGVVNIYSDSDCSQLASEFVKEYGLDAEVLGALTEHIIANKLLAEERLLETAVATNPAPETVENAIQPALSALPDHSLLPATSDAPAPNAVTRDEPCANMAAESRHDEETNTADVEATSPLSGDQARAPASGVEMPNSLASSRRMADREEDAEAEYEALQRQFDARKGKGLRRPSNSGAPAAAMGRTGVPDTSSGAPVKAVMDAAHAARSKMSAATLARLAAAPRKEEMPPLHSKQAKANPLLFDRLHSEASIRDKKIQERMAKARDEETRALDLEKKRLLALGNLPEGMRMPVPVVADICERLYSDGVATQAKKHAVTAPLADSTPANWICAVCGGENVATVDTCETPVKYGKAVQEVSVPRTLAVNSALPPSGIVRKCGASRPKQFHPTISEFAQNITRPLDHDAYMALQLNKYIAERRRREDKWQEKQDLDVKECVFRPSLNLHSLQLAAKRAPASVPGRHVELFDEAKRRQVADEERNNVPAPWHDCTFKPDIGANAFRPRREPNMDEFYSRLHAEGALARARLQQQQSRLDKQASKPRRPHIGPALYEAAVAAREAKRQAVIVELERMRQAANTRHTSSGSERLLSTMRRRALAGIFALLHQSATMNSDQRAAEAAALQSVLPEGEAVVGDHPSIEELAFLIAAVDAHAGIVPDIDNLVDEVHAESVIVDKRVATAVADPLVLADVWTGVLVKPLDRYVEAVIKRLQSSGASSVSFFQFAKELGELLEDLGGGPQIYVMAKKIRASSLSADSRLPTDAHAELTAAPENLASDPLTFAPKIDARSVEMVTKQRANADAGESVALPVHERLHKTAETYAERRRVAEVDFVRDEMKNHPFQPMPQDGRAPKSDYPGLPSALVAQVQELRRKNADLAARARMVMQASTDARAAGVVQLHEPTSMPGQVGLRVMEVDNVSRPETPPTHAQMPISTTSFQSAASFDAPPSFIRSAAIRTYLAHRAEVRPQEEDSQLKSPAFVPMSVADYGYTPTAADKVAAAAALSAQDTTAQPPRVLKPVENTIPALQPVISKSISIPMPRTQQQNGQTGVGQPTNTSLDLKDLEARIERILAVDPATEAKSARRAHVKPNPAPQAGQVIAATSLAFSRANVAASTVKILDMASMVQPEKAIA